MPQKKFPIELVVIILVSICLITIGIVLVVKNYRKKKSITISQTLTVIRNIAFSILGMIIFGAASVYFDYWLQSKIGVNSYAYYLFGVFSGAASFLIIRRNPVSLWYVPIIINAPLLVGIAADTDPAMIGGLIIALAAAVGGYFRGKRRIVPGKL